jgi:FAD/FMN-containing dehydrogenase
MTNSLKPRDEKEVGEALQWALAEGKTFEVMGHGSKRGIGRAAQTDITLDLSGMSGIELYEPDELILSARAGTPIAEIEKALAAHNQELAFEPMDCGPLLGGTPGRGTLGGLVSANLSGPRRIKAGAVRDFALGTRAYSGRGEFFKAGGRVVKNVTGYDLPKFLAGSWGTLAVLTEITIKVLPRADDVETVLVFGLDDTRAVEAMSAAMGSSCEVSGAAHLPAYAASRMTIQSIAGAGNAGDRTAPRRHSGFDRLSPEKARRNSSRLRRSLGAGRRRLAHAVAIDPRRRPLRRWHAKRRLAHIHHAYGSAGHCFRDPERRPCRNLLRLGRRPDLGGDAFRGR